MTEKGPAYWLGVIDRLEGQLADAEQALEGAKDRAAAAILEGGQDDSREIAIARDRIEATQAAIREAKRSLQNALDISTNKQRDSALKRAHEAARQRHTAAMDFDAAMAAAEQAYTRFLGANLAWRTEMMNAGQKAFSTEKLAANEALRGAMTAAAFSLSGALNCRPHNRESRIPLASFVNQQTPPAPSVRATKKKAAE